MECPIEKYEKALAQQRIRKGNFILEGGGPAGRGVGEKRGQSWPYKIHEHRNTEKN